MGAEGAEGAEGAVDSARGGRGRGGLGIAARWGWVGVGVGAGGVWRRVVVCAARRPVRVVHGLSVLFSYLILSYLTCALQPPPQGAHVVAVFLRAELICVPCLPPTSNAAQDFTYLQSYLYYPLILPKIDY